MNAMVNDTPQFQRNENKSKSMKIQFNNAIGNFEIES
jgi:hypothetical protein